MELDSLCFGVSHECIHRLMVGFFLGGGVGNNVSRMEK